MDSQSKTEKIRVYFAAEIFYPVLPGGLLIFFNYAPGLIRNGIEPQVVTLRRDPSQAALERVNGIEIHRLEDPVGGDMNHQRKFVLDAAVKMAREATDSGVRCIVQPASISRQIAARCIEARKAGIPVVHQLTIVPERPQGKGLKERLFRWLGDRLMFRAASQLVSLSAEMRRIYLSECGGISSKRISVISNGVDTARFRPCDNEEEKRKLRHEFDLRPEQKVAIFVGGVMPRKGVDILLRAWDSVVASEPDAFLLILGSNTVRPSHDIGGDGQALNDYLETIRGLHNGLKKPESVRFLGEVGDSSPWYRIADLFVLPTYLEGLPNVVLEAMSSGLPCLISKFKGMPRSGEEFGVTGQHHLLTGHDPEQWAELLAAWLGDANEPERRKMGAEARAWIESHHDLRASVERWADLYRHLSDGAKSP